jgi:CelD/BcsL family acetyltransferase involved in cellulose biosynthesis
VATLAQLPLPALERVPGFDALGDEWDELAEANGSVFGTREWLSLWWEHFGAGRELLLTAGRGGDGSLETILPFYVERTRPLRIVRVLGQGPGDELGPIGDREVAGRALSRWAAATSFDLLVCQQLPGRGAWHRALPGGRLVAETGSPLLDFEGRDWDELLATKSRNLREQVRCRERNLQRDHEVAYRLVSGTDGLAGALDDLFRLHRLRWGTRTTFGRTEAFQRAFAAAAADLGWLRLWLLDLDGSTAAAWLGFRYANAEFYYQAGRDPAHESSSVGFVLLSHTIRSAVEDGADEYRFLRGDEPFKYRFASGDDGLETIVVARGAVGRAALATARAARAARCALRR